MTVNAYIVRSRDHQWIKPYLFRSEAAEIAELMTVISGKLHWIVKTEMADMDMLNALVQFNGRELITDIRNINAVGDGFEADAVIEGHRYRVQHYLPFGPWDIVQTRQVATDESEYNTSSKTKPTDAMRPAPSAPKAELDEVFDPTLVTK